MSKYYFFNLFIIVFVFQFIFVNKNHAQKNILKGEIFGENKAKKEALPQANLYWAGTTQGTVSKADGTFEIKKPKQSNLKLVASFIGYKNDTFVISENQNFIKIILKYGKQLDEVVVQENLGGSYISKINPIQVERITMEGLQKLPCCNLSESFENNASVDVSYSDAVSGAKQIQMLGLAGVYSQILSENIPSIRGLASTYGLAYIPGSWMQSIQISKGTSAVINGYESTTGQINVELKKPEDSDRLFINAYTNSMGKVEGNLTSAYQLNDNISTMILFHAENFSHKIDNNDDSFLDLPTNSQLNFVNRWKFSKHGSFEGQFGVKILDEQRDGGQMNFDKDVDLGTKNSYGIGIETKRYEAFAKGGFFLKSFDHTSIGTMLSVVHHEQNSFFGVKNYEGEQNSLYANAILQTRINSESHKISLGTSYILDDYDETYQKSLYKRTESVIGVFGQYTYSFDNTFNMILGLRTDFNSEYGTFITPRFHAKYNLNETTIFRASAGKGYRVANIFAENVGLLASSRELSIDEKLNEEEAWNFGISLSKDFDIGTEKPLIFLADFYHTRFVNQIIVDLDKDINKVHFYNLSGESYSNSFQTELRYELFKRFEIATAFRWNDVKVTSADELQEKPFLSRYKGLLTLSYATKYDKWKFDFTAQFNGKSRLPNTENMPEDYQQDEMSPSYTIFHGQITRSFKHWDIYVGGENLGNFTQKNPIIASNDPFGKNFDTSMIWGPIVGRMFYAGIRFTIK